MFLIETVSNVDTLVYAAVRFPILAVPQGPFYSRLGKRLKAARDERKLTQERLAAAVDLSRTSVTNIEKGRQIVPVDLLVRFASVLGVAISRLLPEDQIVEPAALDEFQHLGEQERDWAIRVMNTSIATEKRTDDEATLRTEPSKGHRTTQKSKRDGAARSRRAAR